MKNMDTVEIHSFIVLLIDVTTKHNKFVGKFSLWTHVGEVVLSRVIHRRSHYLFDSHAQYHPPKFHSVTYCHLHHNYCLVTFHDVEGGFCNLALKPRR